MTTPFHYVRVCREFISQKVAGRVRRGENCVLLGHPNSGKGYVCYAVADCLKEEIAHRVVRLNLAYGGTVATEDDFCRRMREAVVQAGGADVGSGSGLLDALNGLQVNQPLLFANNVDSMAHHVARTFLQEVRSRVEEGRLVTVLTGEYDLQELVHGPNSEFNVAGQYVLQGFELDEFTNLLERYTDAYGIQFSPADEAAVRLCKLTGGNGDILRAVLFALEDTRFRSGTHPRAAVSLDWLEEKLLSPNVTSWLHRSILGHAQQLIPLAPNCWSNLKKLIDGQPVPLREPMGPPEPLTLSGVAVRTQDGFLEFGCDLVRRAVLEFYNDQRLGDLCASAGRWEEAVEFYKRTGKMERLRPTTALDRTATDRVAHAISSLMYSKAVEGVDAVQRVFAEGCLYALGFSEVVFWQRLGHWEPVTRSGHPSPSSEAVLAGKEILTESDRRSEPALEMTQPWEGAVVGVRLKGLWTDQPFAVLVGDFEHKRLLSKERQRLAEELLDHFRGARDHAVDLQRDKRLLQFRETFERITREIVEALGSQILDVDGVLKSAAAGLRTLGYRRIFFSLIDPTEQHINGVWDESDDAGVNIVNKSRWKLSDPTADIQPFVVREKRPILVEDATTHPLTKKSVVEYAGMQSIAVIPLLTTGNRVLGTVRIERSDRSRLSEEEVNEFFEFGRTLAALIQQGERIHLLQSALDNMPEPLLIVDSCRRVRYGNEPASRLFPTLVPGRWRLTLDQESSVDLKSVEPDLEVALNGERGSHHVQGVGSDVNYRGSVLAEPIRDQRDEITGAFLHIEDLNYFYRVLDALANAARAKDSTSCMERLLEATEILGHQWGRLYLVQESSERLLVSKKQFGFAQGSNEAQEFEKGILLAPPAGPSEESWMSFEQREPIVFCYTSEDRSFRTKMGLKVEGVSRPNCTLLKLPNEYWIDVPLLAGTSALGKISVQCDADLPPEHFEFLKVFSAMASVILEGFGAREDSIRIEVAERSLAKLSHTIGTKHAWLWPQLSSYQRLERDCPKLVVINRSFEEDLKDLEQVLIRAKEMLRGIVLHPQEFDIANLLRHCLFGVIQAGIEGPEALTVVADALHLKSAINEIVANSLKAQKASTEPEILAAVEQVEKEGREYVRIVISDGGPGVPDHIKPRIFEDFFSYDSEGSPGTGLGLGLVRRVIRAHRGSVRETGEPGKGARFEIEIPRVAGGATVAVREVEYVQDLHR